MKEIIGMALFVASLFASSNYVLKRVHDVVRGAALGKVVKGLPSLTKLTKSLRASTEKHK